MKAKMMNIAIPVEVLEESGLDLSAVLELEAGEGARVIRNATGMESFVCDGECEDCPFMVDDYDTTEKYRQQWQDTLFGLAGEMTVLSERKFL